MWVVIFGNHLVSPFFLPENSTGDMYLVQLQNANYPGITEIIENADNYDKNQLMFQQDGAPAHYVRVRQYFYEMSLIGFPCGDSLG